MTFPQTKACAEGGNVISIKACVEKLISQFATPAESVNRKKKKKKKKTPVMYIDSVRVEEAPKA